MKAVTVYKPFDLKIAEVPYPTIEKDNDVIIKVSFRGNLRIRYWNLYGRKLSCKYPAIIGHEFVGTVISRESRTSC